MTMFLEFLENHPHSDDLTDSIHNRLSLLIKLEVIIKKIWRLSADKTIIITKIRTIECVC